MKYLAVAAMAAIRGYQRHISPYKGFACAYRVHTGCASCSQLGLRAIRRYGLVHGLRVLQRRMYLCGVAHRRFGQPSFRPPIQQRGECDLGGCDGLGDLACDGSPGGKSLLSRLCDIGWCCGDVGHCDWPDRKKKPDKERRQKEADVRLPAHLGRDDWGR